MERDSYKLIPLVAYGLGRAAMNVFIKPLVADLMQNLPTQESIDQFIETVARETAEPIDKAAKKR